MDVNNIPVCLGGNYRKFIGKGHIQDGVLTITIRADAIVAEIATLAQIGDIRMLSLGLEYMASKPAISPRQELLLDLRETLDELNRAIERIKREHPDDPARAQYPNGVYILLGALTNKAAVLAAIESLERTIE